MSSSTLGFNSIIFNFGYDQDFYLFFFFMHPVQLADRRIDSWDLEAGKAAIRLIQKEILVINKESWLDRVI